MNNRLVFIVVFGLTMICSCSAVQTRWDASQSIDHAESIQQDATKQRAPTAYRNKIAQIHGLILGIAGAAIGSQVYEVLQEGQFTWQCKEDCSNNTMPLIGAFSGFMVGYIGGIHLGYRVADKRYTKKLERQRRTKNQRNDDKTAN